jgi:hypothetical protein
MNSSDLGGAAITENVKTEDELKGSGRASNY